MMFGQFAFVLSNFCLFKHQKISGINFIIAFLIHNYINASLNSFLVWSTVKCFIDIQC